MQPRIKLDAVESYAFPALALAAVGMLAGYAFGDPAFMRSSFYLLIAVMGVLGCWEYRKSPFLRAVGLVFFVLTLLKLAIPEAHAAAANAPMGEWINTRSDANGILCATVGDPTGLFGCPGTQTIIWPILKTFNLAVFAFAALWMVWQILSASMSSAADGAFLGKNRSGTWVPLRLTIGFAMLVPAFNGFNLAQLVMLWATAVGAGVAGSTATAVAEKISWGGMYTTPPMLRAASIEPTLVEQLRCVAGWKKSLATWEKEAVRDEWDGTTFVPVSYVDPVVKTTWGTQQINVDGVLIIQSGAIPAAEGYDETTCGETEVQLPTISTSADENVVYISQMSSVHLITRINELVAAYSAAVTANPSPAAQNAAFVAVRKAFDSGIDADMAAVVADKNKTESATIIRASIQKHGWIGLGFQGVTATKTAIETSKSTKAEVKSTKNPKEQPEQGFIEDPKAWFEAKINNFMNAQVDSLGNSVANGIRSWGSQNPIAALQGMGVTLIGWVAAAAIFVLFLPILASLAGALIAGAGAAASWIPFVGQSAQTGALALTTLLGSAITGTTQVLTGILLIIGVPLLFYGIKLAAFIPFIIALMWCGAILAWLMVVFESLVGAPLWALTHLDIEGEGMGQKTTHGYMFLLQLLFRPILLVFSLACAMLAMSAIFGLLAGGVANMITQMSSRSTEWFANALLIIGAVVVIATAAETIIYQSLSFLWNIPNNVFAWLGGHFGSNVGQGMEGAGQNAGRAISGAGETAKGAGAHIGGKFRASKQQNQQKKNTEALEKLNKTLGGGIKS